MNKVQHFEIPVDDTGRARKFYEECFGWKMADWPMPNMEYVGMTTGPMDENNKPQEPSFINGGMFKRGGDFPVTGPTVAVTVENLEEALAKVTASGGEVMMPAKDIGGMGWYAYVKDTEGNIIGIWQDVKKA